MCICGYHVLIWLKLPYMCMLIKCCGAHILGNFEVVGNPYFVGDVTLRIAIDLNHWFNAIFSKTRCLHS